VFCVQELKLLIANVLDIVTLLCYNNRINDFGATTMTATRTLTAAYFSFFSFTYFFGKAYCRLAD